MKKLKILVDADACPVKTIVVEIAKKLKIELIMFADTSHEISTDYGEVIVVSKGRDSADFALVNKCQNGDIVVSGDYGLSAMAIAKKAKVITPFGEVLNDDNILQFLTRRDLNQKARKAKIKINNPSKRTKADDEKFRRVFISICELNTVNE